MRGMCVYLFSFPSCQITNQRKTNLIRYHPGAFPFKRLSLFSLIVSYTHISQSIFHFKFNVNNVDIQMS